ncbi:uncharacterized protein K441DRAFT_659487 [Cenococcum geophilum 1.58]|uniref:uncharacterized protein n=1 Tax=Cenococcum geophilum 1.58 TaxID=794803 RepID=UPI00358F0287|nr:hypothetical protein K441DRAFT_659487 [Cenococcum geophilum 1.58]
MRSSIILSTLCLAATAVAQAVSEGIAPSAAAPSGCQPNFSGNFTLNTAAIANTRKNEASEVIDSAVTVTLKNGILHDSLGRTGGIVANRQFQFDGPPQAGSIYTGGWSICANDSLALGGSVIFYKCASGNFYNLYDISIGDQCIPCYIVIASVTQASPTTSSSVAASGSLNSNSHRKSTIGSTASSASGTISVTSSISTSALVSANSAITTGVLSSGFATAAITTSSSSVSGAATAATGTVQSSPSVAAAIATIDPGRTVFGVVAGMLSAAFVLYQLGRFG